MNVRLDQVTIQVRHQRMLHETPESLASRATGPKTSFIGSKTKLCALSLRMCQLCMDMSEGMHTLTPREGV